MFILGYITGLITAILVFTVMNLFKAPIDNTISHTQTRLRAVGVRPKGFIFTPESESEVIRKEVIAKNAAEGKNTNFDELR